jgi:hypothetical protein
MKVRAHLTSQSYPRSGVVTMSNNNYPDRIKFFYEDAKALKKLEDNLFEASINILDNLSNNNNKHEELGRTTFIHTSTFPIYGYNIPDEINAKLNQLPEPVLHDLTNNLIDRLHKYLIQNEKLQTYQYFIGQIRDEWLLKWRFI